MKSFTFTSALLSLVTATACLPSVPPPTTPDKCGCGKALPTAIQAGESQEFKLESKSGVSPRRYRIHIPKSYNKDKRVPVILSFHGRGGNAKKQEALSQFSDPKFGFEGISVYPEGVPDAKGTQQYQGDPDSPDSINDVKFTLELLDHIQERYCIDKTQIWAAGKSNGGGFTGILACDPEATKRIAAFAPVSGAFYLNKDNKVPDCKPIPSRMPIPIMEFHGWEDKTILYEGGDNSRKNRQTRNIVSWVDDWAKRDGFKVDANKTSTLCEGGKKVTRYSWNDVVVHYNYTNVAHDWPSSTPNLDTGDSNDAKDLLTCKEAEATSIILAWFKKWTLKNE